MKRNPRLYVTCEGDEELGSQAGPRPAEGGRIRSLLDVIPIERPRFTRRENMHLTGQRDRPDSVKSLVRTICTIQVTRLQRVKTWILHSHERAGRRRTLDVIRAHPAIDSTAPDSREHFVLFVG